MKVLVVSKTTNLELHGEGVRKRIASGRLPKHHLERLQKGHDDHYRTHETLLRALERHSIKHTEVGRGLFWPDLSAFVAVITVGGDGTILEASHHILDAPVPLMGVRSSDLSVGHLCICGEAGIDDFVLRLSAGELKYTQVQRLRAEVSFIVSGGNVTTDPVLNDFLFANASPAATSRYTIRIDKVKEDQRSSGIWFATAAGSTAAIKAAGGQVVPPTDARFQYVVRELFHPPDRTQTLRHGFFDPDTEKIVIENRCDKAILALDGHHGVLRLGLGDRITFKKAPLLNLALA